MDITEILNRASQCVSDNCGINAVDIKPTDRLADLGMDEIDKDELLSDLEDEFEVDIDDEEFEKCGTVNDVALLIQRELNSTEPDAENELPGSESDDDADELDTTEDDGDADDEF